MFHWRSWRIFLLVTLITLISNFNLCSCLEVEPGDQDTFNKIFDEIELTVATTSHQVNTGLGQIGQIEFIIEPRIKIPISATLFVTPTSSNVLVFPELTQTSKNVYRVLIKDNGNENSTQQSVNFKYSTSQTAFGKATARLILDKNQQYKVTCDSGFVNFLIPQSRSLEHATQIALWVSSLLTSSCIWFQVLKNFQLRSTKGLVFDYVELTWTVSLTGLIRSLLLTSDTVRYETLNRYPDWWPELETRDWLCLINEISAASILIFQTMFYKTGQRPLANLSPFTNHFDAIYIITTVFTLYAVLQNYANWALYLHITNVVYFVSRILRNVMQIYFNYYRKSTENFTVLLPLTELLGCLCQPIVLMFSFINYGQYEITTTLFMAWILMILDKIMLTQHYYWFKSSTSDQLLEPAHEPSYHDQSVTITYGGGETGEPSGIEATMAAAVSSRSVSQSQAD